LINKLCHERTKFKMMRQYDKADKVREGLRTKFNVLIDDRLKQWSVGTCMHIMGFHEILFI